MRMQSSNSSHQPSLAGVEPTDSTPAFPLSRRAEWVLILTVFLAVYFAALFTPALLDDADATHAQAAQHMALTGHVVTLMVDGIRYLEKPPLPYWLVAIDFKLFGFNAFSTHLPEALAVLGCAILALLWGRRAYSERAAFYAALAFLTSVGTFLFTRYFIPESILTLLIALGLYLFLTGLEDHQPSRIYFTYVLLALAMLAKGLIAPVFFLGGVIPYLLLTGQWRRWREFHLFAGTLLFSCSGCSVAHTRRTAQSRSGSSRRQHSFAGQCARIFLFLFHQRTCPALPRQALSPRLQQITRLSILESAPGMAVSMEPLLAGNAVRGVA